MKQGGSRRKGKRFENQVADMIVAAFEDYGITRKDCFSTPLSGGHRWASQTDPGDLVLSRKLRKLFPVAAIECKSYKRLNWRELFRPLKQAGKFGKWWHQAALAGAVRGGEPLLVFKENRSRVFVMFREEFHDTEPLACSHLSTRIGKVRLAACEFWHLLMACKDQLHDS